MRSLSPLHLQFVIPGRLSVTLPFPFGAAARAAAEPAAEAASSDAPQSEAEQVQDTSGPVKPVASAEAAGPGEHCLTCDDGPDVKFTGDQLAQVVRGYHNMRAMLLTVFKTKGGKFIAVRTGLSLWPTERNRQEVKVLEDLNELPAFFGHSVLAKQLYAKLNLSVVQSVD